MEEGYLDTSRLSRIIANPQNKLSYKQEKNDSFLPTARPFCDRWGEEGGAEGRLGR